MLPALLRGKLEEAKAQAYATAERVQQRVLTEENKEKVRMIMEKIGTAVEELVEETNPLGKDNAYALEREVIDLTYVTDRFIAMGFPTEPRRARALATAARQAGKPQTSNNIAVVAAHLKRYHPGQYMLLNVSEESYDYSWFDEQVLEYKFPGHPAPPLGMLFKICASVESWIEADRQNVIAVHCLTGRGRTSVVLACAMTWLGLFDTTLEALAFVAKRRKIEVNRLTIPSQRRYAQYFANVLDGVAPRSEPVVLRRAIMSRAPNFSKSRKGCCPYLQFFKAGKLAYTATRFEKAVDDDGAELDMGPQWATAEDGQLTFEIDCVVHGDVLLRCRHLDDDGGRISMFRAALHAGYAPLGVLRLSKSQLDGACSDERFPNDFFFDLIFETATMRKAEDQVPAPRPDTTPLDKQPPSYDQLLHKDSRFWTEVRTRKRRAAEKRRVRPPTHDDEDTASNTEAPASSPVFAIGDEAAYSLSGLPSSLPLPPSAPNMATDELLERLDEADALFTNDEPPATPAQQQEKDLDDVDLLEQELAEAAPSTASPQAESNFNIDDFESYLNELGASQPSDDS